MARNLTDRYIASLKPTAKRQHIFDSQVPGLCVRVSPGGTKSFTVVIRVKGKQQWRQVGRYGVMSLEEARDAAREEIKRLKRGEPLPEPEPEPESFEDIYRKFLARHVEKKDGPLRSAEEIKRVFRVYILPTWSARPIVSITRRDVANLLDDIEDNHGPVQADKALAHISKLFNWYATRDDLFSSPVVRGMARTKPRERARKRVLSDDEIRSLWPELEGTFGALVKTLLFTGQRRAKVATLRWRDISDGVWTLPTEDKEKGNPGTLPLSRDALKVIEAQPKIGEYVFMGRTSGPLRGFSPLKKKLDKAMPIEHWTLHDLRRTAKTLMQRAGVRPDISERVLGHVIGGVEGTYDRHHYDPEKLDALERLAAEIYRILHPRPENVTELRAAR